MRTYSSQHSEIFFTQVTKKRNVKFSHGEILFSDLPTDFCIQ